MTNNATSQIQSASHTLRVVQPAAWLAVYATVAALLLLAALHVLSPEFSPSWRVISEYALGHYAWVLSLMFLTWAIGTWALALAMWPQIHAKGARIGVWLLILAGVGEALASVFDVTHEVGHGVAGVLGVIGFPVAAMLLSLTSGSKELWGGARRVLVWLANLSWISVVLTIATLAFLTIQMAQINGGHLPQHAPKSLPIGVVALDGWADRLIVLANCAWVLVASSHLARASRPGSSLVRGTS